jgi:hypothetical protein
VAIDRSIDSAAIICSACGSFKYRNRQFACRYDDREK